MYIPVLNALSSGITLRDCTGRHGLSELMLVTFTRKLGKFSSEMKGLAKLARG